MAWGVYEQPDGFHVMPVDDIYEHEAKRACHCHPDIDGNTVIHRSWDGREIQERAEAALETTGAMN
jgi:hypothetical protein